MNKKLNDFVIFKREIKDHLRDRILSLDGFTLYCFLRISANPYGVANTSLTNILHDVYNARSSINYINKILLTLKGNRFLFYKKRTGTNKNTFDVHFSDFIHPKTKIPTDITHLFDEEEALLLKKQKPKEIGQNPEPISQNLKFKNNHIGKMLRGELKHMLVRTSNNDNNKDTENDIENDITSISKDLGNHQTYA